MNPPVVEAQAKPLITPEGRRLLATTLKLETTEIGFRMSDGKNLTDAELIRMLAEAAKLSSEVEASFDLIITRLNRSPTNDILSAIGLYHTTFDGLWSDFKRIRENLGLKRQKFC